MKRPIDSRVLFVGVAAALAILLTITALTFSMTRRLIGANQLTLETQQSINQLEAALLVVVDAETGRRGYVITGEARFLEPYRLAMAAMNTTIAQLDKWSARNPVQKRRLERLRQVVAAVASHFERSITAREARPHDVALQVAMTAEGKVMVDEIRSIIGELTAEESARLTRLEEESDHSAQLTLTIIATGAATAFLLLVVVFILFQREGTALRQASSTLESSVEKRTAELANANARLLRTNRTITALSRCNQALARATNEDSLLADICEIVVETTGYRSCRVMEMQPGGGGAVHTRAGAGKGLAALETIDAAWAAADYGPSPSARAILTGAPVVLHLEPGLQTGLRHPESLLDLGYRSLVTIPLRDQHGVWGALDLGSEDPASFDEEEFTLLNNMAGDLEFGVNSLHAQALQQRTAAQLHQVEYQYRAILQTALDSLVVQDRHGAILEVNDSFCRLLGYTSEQVIALGTHSLIAGRSSEQIDARTESIVRTGSGRWETQLRASDSRLVDVEVSANFLAANDRIVLFLRDITARKLADKALRESEAIFKSFMNNLPGAASIMDDQRRLVFLKLLNPSGATADKSWLGRTPEEAALFSESEPGRRNHTLVAETHQTIVSEEETSRDGAQRTLLTIRFPIPREDGSVLVGALSIDVTERKHLELALRKSEAHLRLALSAAELGTWTLERATQRFDASQRSFAMFGLAPDGSHSAADFFRCVHPDDRDALTAQIQQTYHLKSTLDAEHRVIWPDGSIHWIAVYGRSEGDSDGSPLRVAGIHQDITARKLAEAEIRSLATSLEHKVEQRTAELEAANRELEAFSYSVSHDLRAPLRAIDGFVRILLEDYTTSLDSEGVEVCHVISDSARRMAQLIDDLLTFSRLGRASMQMSSIDMATLAHSIFFELTTPDYRHRCELHLESLPPATGDAALIRQVWANLLSNAIKFSSKRSKPVIFVQGALKNNELVYSVHDNGAGFDMRYVKKLFSVFQRLHSDEEFEGTGVGLAIVQRIIHRHGGRVSAEGQPDAGATISFTLPAQGAKS